MIFNQENLIFQNILQVNSPNEIKSLNLSAQNVFFQIEKMKK
jgi:hypothetical protein